jgi:hypothetical protein
MLVSYDFSKCGNVGLRGRPVRVGLAPVRKGLVPSFAGLAPVRARIAPVNEDLVPSGVGFGKFCLRLA